MQFLIMAAITIASAGIMWGLSFLLRKDHHSEGPRLQNREVQFSSYGITKPLSYGMSRLTMALIWAKKLREVQITHEYGKGGGGKGGTSTEYQYFGSWAGVFCEAPDPAVFGPIRLLKLWLDDKLVCNYLGDNEKVVAGGAMKKFRFYSGSETQLPNSTIEAHKGVGNVPAFRGDCYGVFNDLFVTNYGNRIPTTRALIGQATPKLIGVVREVPGYDYPDTGYFGSYYSLQILMSHCETYIVIGRWKSYPVGDDNAYQLTKINTITGEKIVEKVFTRWDLPNPCSGKLYDPLGNWHHPLAMDEQGRVYSGSCNGYGDFVRLNAATFEVEKHSPTNPRDELLSKFGLASNTIINFSNQRVSRNPAAPYLWGSSDSLESGAQGVQPITLIQRETMANPFNMFEAAYFFAPPLGILAGSLPRAECVRHDDGSLYVLWFNGYEEKCWVERLFPNGTRQTVDHSGGYLWNIYPHTTNWQRSNTACDHMAYCPDSDQLIICANDNDSPYDAYAYFVDGTTLEYITRVKFPDPQPYFYGAQNEATFQRGVKDGKIFITNYWEEPAIIWEIDVPTRTITEVFRTTELSNIYCAVYSSVKMSVFCEVWLPTSTEDTTLREILLYRLESGTVGLADIVTDLSLRSNLLESQINVYQLTDRVKGFTITDNRNIRRAIEDLQDVFIFDAAEVDGVIHYYKRGLPSVATIPESDLGAHRFDDEGDRAEPLEVTVRQVTELPQAVTIIYPEPTRNLEPASQTYQRQLAPGRWTAEQTVQVVLHKDEAKQLAHKKLKWEWTAKPCELSLPPKYARLACGDVITVIKTEAIYRILLSESQSEGLLRHWKGIVESVLFLDVVDFEGEWNNVLIYDTGAIIYYDGAIYRSLQDGNTGHDVTDTDWWEPVTDEGVYDSDEEGTEVEPIDEEVFYPGPSNWQLLDLPPLLDNHDLAGVYLASGAYFAAWQGCRVYVSKDSGENWSTFSDITARSITGVALNALGDFPFNCVDRGNTLNIRLDMADDVLASITESEFWTTRKNSFAVGYGDRIEVIRARDIVANEDGTYTLSHLLRGLCGTEYAIDGHLAGDKVVMLSTATTFFQPLDLTWLNQSYLYNGLAMGEYDWDSGTFRIFTTGLRTLLPWSPCHVEGERDGANNLTLTCVRRARINNGWNNGVEVPLGETTEAYEIDILDGGGAVVRTITANTPQAEYSAAEQTADGLTPGDPVDLAWHMMSATVGRGFPAYATV
jgi:hypothetical protein